MKTRRVGHTKSRTGCLRCKKRRVKCDECVPCAACQRHGTPCSLEASYRYAQGESSSPGATCTHVDAAQPVRMLDGDGTTEQTTPYPTPMPSSSPASMPTKLGGRWISDMELMHHYSSVAYRTLSFSTNVSSTLQLEVPREAISHPFFLHEILAFSAFHLAYLHPSKRSSYVLHASRHQSLAIRGIRDALAGSINAGNCHALFGTSLFLTVSAFAASPSCEDHHKSQTVIKTLIDILSLIGGLGTILRSSEYHILAGPLRGLFSPYPSDGSTDSLKTLLDRLSDLRTMLLAPSNFYKSTTQLFIASTDALVVSITALRKDGALGAPPEIRAVFFWPTLVLPGFLDLARRNHPATLVILAHYTTLIHLSERHCWFLESWARHLVDDLAREVSGSSWAHMISWVIDLVREGHPKPIIPK